MEKEKISCLVVGGSGALGSEICRVLHQEGCNIAFTYHQNETKAKELASQLIGSFPLYCDLQKPENAGEIVAEAVHKLGNLDALIFASGIAGDSFFYENVSDNQENEHKITPAQFDEMMNVNSKGVFFTCLAAIAILKQRPKSNIIVLGSLDCVKNVPSPMHFAMSKTSLKGMVATMAKEWGKHNVCINIVAPGILEGGASLQLGSDRTDEYIKHCSLKRLGKMREVADTVCWLALENTYLTGQSILLDGGL